MSVEHSDHMTCIKQALECLKTKYGKHTKRVYQLKDLGET